MGKDNKTDDAVDVVITEVQVNNNILENELSNANTKPNISPKEVRETNANDNEDKVLQNLSKNILKDMEYKKSRLESLISTKSNLCKEMSEIEEKIVKNIEDERRLKGMREKVAKLITKSSIVDLEVSNLSNGISSCDSEIHDLELRLKKARLLRDNLCERRSEKYEKLKTLEEDKRLLSQNINSEAVRSFEERANNSKKKVELTRKLNDVNDEIEKFDTSDGSQELQQIKDLLYSQIKKKEKELECHTCRKLASPPFAICQKQLLFCAKCIPADMKCSGEEFDKIIESVEINRNQLNILKRNLQILEQNFNNKT